MYVHNAKCANTDNDLHFTAPNACMHAPHVSVSPELRLPYQGCQIFLDTINQNDEKYTKLTLNYQMAIKYTK
jgi:hypothetical protein